MKRFAPILVSLALSACATLPASLHDAAVQKVTVTEARRGPARIGVDVRWGGEIARVRNGVRHTWIEIVDQPLGGDGRPIATDGSDGRFLARFEGFLDPAIYRRGRQITVVGRLEPEQTHLIGKFAYQFPVVFVRNGYLWQPLPKHPPGYYASPFWNDPWYPWGSPFF